MQMIIHGLVNSEIKLRVLRRTGNDELPTLAELVNYVAAEEISCSESLSVHSESNTVGHVRQRKSSYKKNQGKCNFCGAARHPSSNSPEDRQKFCKAFGKTCSKCGKSNHYSSLCQSGRQNSRQVSEIETDPNIENLCSITAASLYSRLYTSVQCDLLLHLNRYIYITSIILPYLRTLNIII